MNDETMRELFFDVACAAIEAGREIRLGKEINTNEGNVLNGVFSKNSYENDTLFLHVYAPGSAATGIKEGEDGSEEAES